MKTITELAREAGATAEYLKHYDTFIARFAALIRAAALEDVANMVGACDPRATPKGIATAIRARGNT